MFESPVRFWLAVGLMIPATALFGWAALTFRGVPGEEWTWAVPGILVATAVSVPLLVLIRWGELKGAAGRLKPEPPLGRSEADGSGWRLLALLPLLCFLVAFVRHHWQTIIYSPDQGDRVPVIDFSPHGVAWGGAFLVVGLCILFFSPRALGGRRAHRFAGGGAGMAVSSTVFAAVFAAALLPAADSRPAAGGAAEAATAPVPERVSEVAWRWEAPEGDTVSQTLPAGPGAVVRHDSGVAALDTVEGEELWSFHREGERTRDMVASPDGSLVVVTFLARARTEGHTLRLVALDAHTGEIRTEHEAPHRQGVAADLDLPAGFTLTPEGTYVYTLTRDDPADDRVVARSVDSGEATWEFVPPEDCYLTFDQGEGAYHVLGDEALVVMQCAPEAAAHTPEYHRYPRHVHDQELVVLGLDPVDGTEIWRHEESVTTDWTKVSVLLGADHGVLALEWPEGPDEEQTERLFLGPGGAEADREPPARDPRIQLLTQDGHLESGGTDGESLDVWRPRTGEERTAPARYSIMGDGIGKSVLDDTVVTATHLYDLDNEELNTVVSVEPWDDIEGAERHEFEVDLVGDRNPLAGGDVSLFPAPGSVVLSAHTYLVLGLA